VVRLKVDVFDNRRLLVAYCQDDVIVLRHACQVVRSEIIHIGNIKVFLESISIASACNKVLHKRFQNPDTIGLIPTGRYTSNNKFSKNARMWLVYREKADGCTILHGLNGSGYRLPEFSDLSVDGFCPETKIVYEFYGCFWHGYTCLPFRDVITVAGETLAERYEHTMARIGQITRAAYEVEFMCECDFDVGILARHPELKTPCSTTQSSEHSRCIVRVSNGGHETALQDTRGGTVI
jgi:G:T-mismatch repair DNA endonuclease (very short patch repair protein)